MYAFKIISFNTFELLKKWAVLFLKRARYRFCIVRAFGPRSAST